MKKWMCRIIFFTKPKVLKLLNILLDNEFLKSFMLLLKYLYRSYKYILRIDTDYNKIIFFK